MTRPRDPFSPDPQRRGQASDKSISLDSAQRVAADLAGEILGFLAAEPERLRRFLDICGLTPQTLRAAAGEPGFATGLLDYLASDDRLLLGFAEETGLDPARIDAARRALTPTEPGPDP